jgi:Flp pilus assembly protein TadB
VSAEAGEANLSFTLGLASEYFFKKEKKKKEKKKRKKKRKRKEKRKKKKEKERKRNGKKKKRKKRKRRKEKEEKNRKEKKKKKKKKASFAPGFLKKKILTRIWAGNSFNTPEWQRTNGRPVVQNFGRPNSHTEYYLLTVRLRYGSTCYLFYVVLYT